VTESAEILNGDMQIMKSTADASKQLGMGSMLMILRLPKRIKEGETGMKMPAYDWR
jgi:hypothetical protein